MSTGYMVEMVYPDHVEYLGDKGYARRVPKIFTGAALVKRAIARIASYDRDSKSKLRITRITHLERGIKHSSAQVFSYDEFMATDFSKKTQLIPNHPNAIYKIQLNTDLALASNTKPIFANAGIRKEKFGKSWTRASDLRSHITSRIDRLQSSYKNAKVHEIEMHDDGIATKTVKTYPILDFYCSSPSSRSIHDAFYPKSKYTPTPELT
jgi:hypothetical protein